MHPDTIEALATDRRADLDREAERWSLAAEARSGRALADRVASAGGPVRRGGVRDRPVHRGLTIVDLLVRMRRLARLRA
jgi:hypothetical protein